MEDRQIPEAPHVGFVLSPLARVRNRLRFTTIAVSGPMLFVIGSIVTAFAVYAVLAHFAKSPRVFGDELWYVDAAASLVRGDGLSVRGSSYGFGPLYPIILAAILWPVRDRETAYELFKTANALFFAFAGIPVYVLARRVLTRWWSAGVAAASLAIPSCLYVSVVMTESVSYLVTLWALLAMALALERPSTSRQIAVLSLIVLSYTARPQLICLYVTYLIAIVVWAVVRKAPARERPGLLALWPTAVSLVVGVGVLILLPELRGSSPSKSFGSYSVLWRSYDVGAVAKWTIYHLADLDLYLGVIPFAVAPIACWILISQLRAGSTRALPFLTVFLTANAVGILVVAAFSSTEFGFGRLHDRNLFYLVPLWLILFALWLQEGLPRRPLALMIAGVVAALFLPVRTARLFTGDWQFDALATPLWARVSEHVYQVQYLDLRRVLALFGVVAVAAVVLLPRRLKWALPAVVLLVFATNGYVAWQRTFRADENKVFKSSATRDWLDDTVGRNGRVTALWIVSPQCDPPLRSGDPTLGFELSEFFNWSVRRAAFVTDTRDSLPADRVMVGKGGRISLASGAPLVANYVLTQPGVRFRGRRLAVGSAAQLVLWRIGGPVRTVDASSDRQLRRQAATASCAVGEAVVP